MKRKTCDLKRKRQKFKQATIYIVSLFTSRQILIQFDFSSLNSISSQSILAVIFGYTLPPIVRSLKVCSIKIMAAILSHIRFEQTFFAFILFESAFWICEWITAWRVSNSNWNSTRKIKAKIKIQNFLVHVMCMLTNTLTMRWSNKIVNYLNRKQCWT